MDVDFKTPHQENGAKDEEDPVQKEKAPPDAETNGTLKDSPKHTSRQKRGQRRSRSRTPQKKAEETKTLQISLKKINAELSGKELKEEIEKTEEDKKDANALNDGANKKEVTNKDADKEDEGISENGKQSKNQKNEDLKKDEVCKKQESQGKEGATKSEETPKKESPKKEAPKKETPKKEKKEKMKKQDATPANDVEADPVEMDPLIISDEPDPELQFDENSEGESGKDSPVISRCVTRRSQTRNIPTPKTPKSVDQDLESEKNSVAHTPIDLMENDTDVPKKEMLIDSRDSEDNINLSTRVVVGSDITRMDYMENHNSNITEDLSYLNASRERSLSETLRSLSARRPIRPIDDYRRRALRINQEKSDLNIPYSSHHSVEHITTGLKRKSRSITPEDSKKFKTDSPGLNSLFTSPLSNFRNKFRSDLPSALQNCWVIRMAEASYTTMTSKIWFRMEMTRRKVGARLCKILV